MIKALHIFTLLVYMVCFTSTGLHAQTDTSLKTVTSSLKEQSDAIRQLSTSIQQLKDKQTAKTDTTAPPCKCVPICANRNLSHNSIAWLLVFLPVILFLLVGYYAIRLLLRGRFDLSETLSTIKMESIRTADVTTTTPRLIGSTSRLVAFITGITALLIAVCLVTYYAYFTIAECGGNLQFDGLWKILAGLGIGVIPYGINVLKGNNKEAS